MRKDKAENSFEKKETVSINGSVESVIYRSDSGEYTVIELITDKGESAVAVGNMPYISEGEEAVLYGRWTHHAEYGRQFSVESYEKKLPSGAAAILKYLSSRAVRGVGAATAIKIVERYGDDTFDVMENHPDWLADIPGISQKRAKEIHDSFVEQTGIRNLMMFCRDYFGSAAITRIYNRYGGKAVGIIRENPYRLCSEIYGIGFERADALAASLGIGRESRERIVSGLIYLLQYNANTNGHCCLPREKLEAAATEKLDVAPELIVRTMEDAAKEGILCVYRTGEKEYWYLRSLYEAERDTAERLFRLDQYCPVFDLPDIERLIEKSEIESGIQYAPMQRCAIREAMKGGVLILTGGPGTGKTTIIKGLLNIFNSLGMKVALAAPTGRAAKRMSEATSAEAKTVHRLLETVRTDGELPVFGRNARCPLEEDVFILDESSMLDIQLADAFLRAVKNGARVIFVGDSDQLPSVGAGNVLGDMIGSGCLNTVRLNEIFRQSESSLIVTNAHRINAGKPPELTAKDNDFFFLPRREEQISATIVDLMARRLPRAYGETITEQMQLITPSRRGGNGTEALNLLLQETLNPKADKKTEIVLSSRTFREGDRVMQIRNNYAVEWLNDDAGTEGVFNGDIGIVEKVDPLGNYLDVRYDERHLARYDRALLEELELAYAITVHKSQGSEYGTVIIPLYSCPPMLKTRNLLYTAVTRARTRVILVGRRDILEEMIRNNRQLFRYTMLAERLRETANFAGL